MSGTWINADMNFGLPYAVFMVPLASPLGERVLRQLKQADIRPGQMEAAIRSMIEEARPELRGASVLSMRADALCHVWEFSVAHPSLPRVAPGGQPALQYLERCAECGGPVKDMGAWLRTDERGRSVLCCSAECCERKPDAPLTRPARSGHDA